MYCQNCGSKMRFRDEVCPQCGTPAEAPIQMEIFDGKGGKKISSRTYPGGSPVSPSAKQGQTEKKGSNRTQAETENINMTGEEEMRLQEEMEKLEQGQRQTTQKVAGYGRKLNAVTAVLGILLAAVLIMNVMLWKQTRDMRELLNARNEQIGTMQTEVDDLKSGQDALRADLQNSAQQSGDPETETKLEGMMSQIDQIRSTVTELGDKIAAEEQQEEFTETENAFEDETETYGENGINASGTDTVPEEYAEETAEYSGQTMDTSQDTADPSPTVTVSPRPQRGYSQQNAGSGQTGEDPFEQGRQSRNVR